MMSATGTARGKLRNTGRMIVKVGTVSSRFDG